MKFYQKFLALNELGNDEVSKSEKEVQRMLRDIVGPDDWAKDIEKVKQDLKELN